MRQNQNPILRSAVTEGKSMDRSSEHERQPNEYRGGITEQEIAERPPGRPAGIKFPGETTPCRRFSLRYRPRWGRGIARPGRP
jgi:hypothetical protein